LSTSVLGGVTNERGEFEIGGEEEEEFASSQSWELVVEEVVEVGYSFPARILVDGTHVVEGDGGDLD